MHVTSDGWAGCSRAHALSAKIRPAIGAMIGPLGRARVAKLASRQPQPTSHGRAHARASGARDCASPPLGKPLLCRASRCNPRLQARPPVDVRPLGRRRGPAVRSGAGRVGRRPNPHTPRPASRGSLGRPPRRGLYPFPSRPAGGRTRFPEAGGGVECTRLEGGEAGYVLFKTLLGSRFWLSRSAFSSFQS